MLFPMKAETLHMGSAQMMMSPRKPMAARKMPRIWRPAEAISFACLSLRAHNVNWHETAKEQSRVSHLKLLYSHGRRCSSWLADENWWNSQHLWSLRLKDQRVQIKTVASVICFSPAKIDTWLLKCPYYLPFSFDWHEILFSLFDKSLNTRRLLPFPCLCVLFTISFTLWKKCSLWYRVHWNHRIWGELTHVQELRHSNVFISPLPPLKSTNGGFIGVFLSCSVTGAAIKRGIFTWA